MIPEEIKALSLFSQEYLQFPPFVVAFNEIERMVEMYRTTRIAQNLLITGESGSGKTTLCELIEQKYPRLVLPERDVVPILFISIPPAATISSVAEALLGKLGDPTPTVGTNPAKTFRVIRLAKACGVELLLFDETNHIYDRGQSPTQYLVGDWLKGLIDSVKVPTVMVGIPRVKDLLRVNEQLRRRFTRHKSLELGKGTESIEEECLSLFTALTPSLPLPFSKGSASWRELASRLYFATDGRVGYLKILLIAAIRVAYELQLEKITPQELAMAFTEEVWQQGIGPLNPFHEKFIFRRLDRQGEPFEQGALVARPRKISHAV